MAALEILGIAICDVSLSNRIRNRKEALSGGMPLAKYLANRALTLIEDMLPGQTLGERRSLLLMSKRDAGREAARR